MTELAAGGCNRPAGRPGGVFVVGELTANLTQGRADRVIEQRGANGTHVHLDRVEGNGHAG